MVTQRGRILRDTNVGPGLLNVSGKQYTFTLEDMWESELPPRPGMTVDVGFDMEGKPQTVRMVPETQIAKEQAEQALSEAKRQGGAIVSGVRTCFGLLPLVVEGLMLISFFVLPNLQVGNAYARHALTGWEAIGLNMATEAVNDHGLLSLLAILCLLAPLCVSFVRRPWSRWLYVAPLGFALLAFATLFAEIQHAGQVASQGMGTILGGAAAAQMSREVTGMFTVGMGAYLVLICSAYLAFRTLRTNS